jgi:hypothetical protein
MVIIPGGRGSFVLAVLYVLLAFFEVLRVRRVKKILQGMLLVVGVVSAMTRLAVLHYICTDDHQYFVNGDKKCF